MLCNKDEAGRAKELAEKKFAEKDLGGAKRFALMAQRLYSDLDGLHQLLATIDVHISFGERNYGIVDWYRVLGVEPLADDDIIRKNYRKLALILHPDKNKSVGAEGAFHIISEAWSLLSDKSKRIAYDQKRKGIFAELLIPKSSPSVPTGENQFHNFASNTNFNAWNQSIPPFFRCPAPHLRLKPTFWTTCSACKTQFEYLRVYIDISLLCPCCRRPFLAIETAPPPLNSFSTSWSSYTRHKNSGQTTVNENSYSLGRKPASATIARPAGSSGVDLLKKTFQTDAFLNSGSTRSALDPSLVTAQVAGEVQPSCGQLKRAREEAKKSFLREEDCQMKTHDFKKGVSGLSTGLSSAVSSSVPKEDRPKKRRRKDEQRKNNNEKEIAKQISTGNRGVCMFGSESDSFEKRKVEIAGNHKPNGSRELPQLEIRSMLMNMAKKVIGNKLDEWRLNAVPKTSNESNGLGKEMKERKGNQKVTGNVLKADANKHIDFVDAKTDVQTKKSSFANSDVELGENDSGLISMSVPDPDFHDFDQDRTVKSFGENQVWAAYDNDDGMPRYYAMIHSVISLRPFKMRISWLNSKSNNELSPLNWIGSGFVKTSGDFWRGKYEVYNSLNSFSHKVGWVKGTRGAIQIYPRKGDVWALYTNWSDDWNEHTPDEVVHKYDMVEVLEDYNEATGVTVVQLVKVPGFKTVFHRSSEQRQISIIPRKEMFRFSHRVPSYILTGEEGNNAPKGCLELDPASTPLELLQLLTEAQLEDMKTTNKAKEEHPLEGVKNPKGEELVEKNEKTTKENGIAEDVQKNIRAETMMKKGKEIGKGNLLVYRRGDSRNRKGTRC
ncbi:hypothetical protein LWI29_032945 [Acer saccharum]|uniref:J domain-containing protein n=1 Tax=Acer saccharum TaxID=4024 RepID=A0AA39SDR4_ACESA|nr:hypothetical protein LWI29_032945 [Acer saccharum]